MTVTATQLPEGLLLAYYGDDFTGSTDLMEAFTAAGVPTVLLLREPSAHWIKHFQGVRCIGLAGTSRGKDPAWMEQNLARAFEQLASLGAPILQYKVCSTFDSSPQVGSIGKAIDIGVPLMKGKWSPMVVGAPRLKRYQMFGHLFAAYDGQGWRLDRHPTMSRHPVTPMHESDLRVHLGLQTTRRIELIDMPALKAGHGNAKLQQMQGKDVPVVLLDVMDEDTLVESGRLAWEGRGEGVFTASSSGLEYALAAYWKSLGWLPQSSALEPARAASQIAVVSGSCSPATALQIRWAREHGFQTERLDVKKVLDPALQKTEIQRVVGLACNALQSGKSVVVFSAEGPEDESVRGFDQLAAIAGMLRSEANVMIGQALAHVMKSVIESTTIQRVVLAGGDSSGEVASTLGIEALTVMAGLEPGAPLCRAASDNPRMNGLEIVLKGGQMGGVSFFGTALHGIAT